MEKKKNTCPSRHAKAFFCNSHLFPEAYLLGADPKRSPLPLLLGEHPDASHKLNGMRFDMSGASFNLPKSQKQNTLFGIKSRKTVPYVYPQWDLKYIGTKMI